jgi:hypothetical protein
MHLLTQKDPLPQLFFKDIVRLLVADPSDPKGKLIRGCQVFIPETVFFNEDGRVDFLTTTDRDCCVAFALKTRMDSNSLYKRIRETVLERKLDTDPFSKQHMASCGNQFTGKPELVKKQDSSKVQ